MTLRTKMTLLASACVLGLAAAFSLPGDTSATATSTIGYGPDPELAFPQQTLIPTINVAPARPWSEDERPEARWFAVGCLAIVLAAIGIVAWVYAG